ncbi:MAG TPA: GntR family transcriptional regulator [Xanthobacteraceae bacterium]|nr:GntR family transcriptional regulator [Xanthobacteraceae bacterium]
MDLESAASVLPVSAPRDGSRSEAVFRSLLGWIQDGRFAFDSKLPTENELTQQFQVSRPVVRAAIAKLREKGLVRSVQGSGTIVIYDSAATAAPTRREMLQGSVRDLQRCFEFRLLIESEAAYLAALRHGPASLKRISECVYPASYEFPAVNPKPGETFNFHQAVVLAADNVFLEKSMELVMSQPGFQVYLRLRGATRAPDPVEHRATINGEHLQILKLIERRQADDAREYMRYHIQSAYDLLINRIPVTDTL